MTPRNFWPKRVPKFTCGENAIAVTANQAVVADSSKLADTITANGDKLDGYGLMQDVIATEFHVLCTFPLYIDYM